MSESIERTHLRSRKILPGVTRKPNRKRWTLFLLPGLRHKKAVADKDRKNTETTCNQQNTPMSVGCAITSSRLDAETSLDRTLAESPCVRNRRRCVKS
jgi:hypothetical protein